MERTSLSLNANSAATRLNGFAGVTLTFVSHAIKSNVRVTMSANTRKSSCQNVKVLESARQEGITMVMGNRGCWDVQFAVIIKKTIKDFDRLSLILNKSLL